MSLTPRTVTGIPKIFVGGPKQIVWILEQTQDSHQGFWGGLMIFIWILEVDTESLNGFLDADPGRTGATALKTIYLGLPLGTVHTK